MAGPGRPVSECPKGPKYYRTLASQMAALITSIEIAPGPDPELNAATISAATEMKRVAVRHVTGA